MISRPQGLLHTGCFSRAVTATPPTSPVISHHRGSAYGLLLSGSDSNTTNLTGNITTAGTNAYGLWLNISGSNTTNLTGNITTTGDGAAGLFLSSSDSNTTTITGDIITSGTDGDAEPILLENSDSNTITLSGKVQSLGGDQAISIDADSDANTFNIQSGSTFLGDFENLGTNTVITNQGTMDGIENTGSIATFNNYQTGATYTGTLPDNYTTIIDDSGYGQLFVSNEVQAAAGATNYSPYAGSAGIGVKIKTNTYNNVITGVSSANIASLSGTLTGDGTCFCWLYGVDLN